MNMKMTKLMIAAVMAGSFSVSALAAESVNSGEGLNRLGSVSVSGAASLTELESKLAKKAEAAGAGSYQIISAGGDDKLRGMAILYK